MSINKLKSPVYVGSAVLSDSSGDLIVDGNIEINSEFNLKNNSLTPKSYVDAGLNSKITVSTIDNDFFDNLYN